MYDSFVCMIRMYLVCFLPEPFLHKVNNKDTRRNGILEEYWGVKVVENIILFESRSLMGSRRVKESSRKKS